MTDDLDDRAPRLISEDVLDIVQAVTLTVRIGKVDVND